MDIISHGLWGAAAFGRKNRKNFRFSFFMGIMPDFLSFGILFIAIIFGFYPRPNWASNPPPIDIIPSFISYFYNITHSLIIFTAIFLIIWFIAKKPFWPLAAWGLHIIIDIPSHSLQFFATPFLWPISDFKVNGISWSAPEIFIPNIIFLVILYTLFFIKKKKVVKNL